MNNTSKQTDLNKQLAALKPKSKEPNSRRVLDSWISHAENNISGQGNRLSWLIATTIVVAVLQQVVDVAGDSRFFLKGGVLLQYKLDTAARATKDLDGIVKGDLEDFLIAMDEHLQQSWGPLTFRRSEIETIRIPSKLINPRSFELMIDLRGQTWRRVKVEISPDEGSATNTCERISAPSLAGFGPPTPDYLTCMSMSYQIAQKVHAGSDPHDPPDYVNNRPRDIVDLLLLSELAETTGCPSQGEIKTAIEDIFKSRAKEAKFLDRQPRTLPATFTAYPHWEAGYTIAAESSGVTLSLQEATKKLNNWLKALALTSESSA